MKYVIYYDLYEFESPFLYILLDTQYTDNFNHL